MGAEATVDVAELGLLPRIQHMWTGYKEEATIVDIDFYYCDVGETAIDEPD